MAQFVLRSRNLSISVCFIQNIVCQVATVSSSRKSSTMKTILGTMEMGRRLDLQQSKEMLIKFQDSGNLEIDTAFMYAGGKTEEYMGKSDVTHSKEMKVASKANPWDKKTLSPESVRKQLETSLNRLGMKRIQLFYLHAPDPTTPITDTLKTVNDLYEEGKFEEFGLSNYSSWQVAEIYTICKSNKWIIPTVYQGMYNCLTRQVEKELFPCLRYFGMRFYAYNPLAGGILSGKHKFEDAGKTEPGRFFGAQAWAKAYRDRFWKKENFESIGKIQTLLDEIYGEGEVSIAEASYRWLYHHSVLDANKGDGVIIGASTMDHYRNNMSYATKDKLDERVVKQMDECWRIGAYDCPNYFR